MECYPIERKPAFIPPPPPQKSLDQLPLYDNAESNDNPPQQQPSHLLFDEYDTASLWSYNTNNLERLWTFCLDGRIVLPEFWNTWKDYGYCFISHFFFLSQKQSPTCYIDQLLPYHQAKNKSSDKIDNMVIQMGAQGMLDEAGDAPNTHKSPGVFVYIIKQKTSQVTRK